MTKWLEAAQRADTEVLSVSSVLSERVSPPALRSVETPETKPTEPTKPSVDDPEAYLAHLQEHGPKPYGAVAAALGWGATRAWQAEARLRASGQITIDSSGRGAPREASDDRP